MGINGVGSSSQALSYIKLHSNVQASNVKTHIDPDHDGDIDPKNGPDMDKRNGLGRKIDMRA